MATCCCFWNFKEWVYLKGRKKISYWCMPFCRTCFLFFSLRSFSLLYYFSFNSLCFSYLRSSPSPFVATVPIYIGLILWDFSILPLELHQLFLVYGGHPFKVAHQPIGCLSTTITWHAQCILFLPLLVTWKVSPFFDLGMSLFSWFEWIRPWGFSLPTSLACITWHFPKRVPGWKLKIGSLPPLHPTTSSKSLNHGPTSLVLVEYKLVVLRSLYACSTTSLFLFSFIPTPFLPLQVSFIFILLRVPSTHVYPLWREDCGPSSWAYFVSFYSFLG